MKKLIPILTLLICAEARSVEVAHEFDRKEEVACHKEIQDLGCVDSADEEILDCVERQKAKLSPTCQSIHLVKSQK